MRTSLIAGLSAALAVGVQAQSSMATITTKGMPEEPLNLVMLNKLANSVLQAHTSSQAPAQGGVLRVCYTF